MKKNLWHPLFYFNINCIMHFAFNSLFTMKSVERGLAIFCHLIFFLKKKIFDAILHFNLKQFLFYWKKCFPLEMRTIKNWYLSIYHKKYVFLLEDSPGLLCYSSLFHARHMIENGKKQMQKILEHCWRLNTCVHHFLFSLHRI